MYWVIVLKDLKIIFVNSIKEKLCYPIYELKKEENGFYKIENIQKNSVNDSCMLCYRITMENMLLESIYPDKVVVMKQVVENLFQFQENEIVNSNVKVFKKTSSTKNKL